MRSFLINSNLSLYYWLKKRIGMEVESLIGLVWETVGIKEGLGGIFMDIRHILMQLEAEG